MKVAVAATILLAAAIFGGSARAVLMHFGQSIDFANSIGGSVGVGTLLFFMALAWMMRIVKKEN